MIKYSVILTILLIPAAFAVTPVYDNPVPIQASGSNINVGSNGSPFVFDWNSDGRKDLLLGQYTEGRIRFYANTGTNNNPAFGTFTYLQADGSDIILSYG